METVSIQFTNEQLLSLYRNGGDEARLAVKEALGENFSEKLPVTERIKTLDDAVRELGDDHPSVKAWRSIKYGYAVSSSDPETADILAYVTLRIIVDALNEGWRPEFTEDEYRYYPWFSLYTQEDIDEMSDERKEELGLLLWGGVADGGSYCGLGSVRSSFAFSYSSASCGSRLALKSKELAIYCGRQFGKIYADFCFIPASRKAADE